MCMLYILIEYIDIPLKHKDLHGIVKRHFAFIHTKYFGRLFNHIQIRNSQDKIAM